MSVKENVVVDEKVKIDIQPPKLWKVVFLNDNVTPMELVIDILTTIFKHNQESAKKITLEIHNEGSGVAGVYPYEIAEHLAVESKQIARSNGSPLKVQVERE
jgi:ATP-dependent Clp protease adaptor protein ClpS